MIRLLLAGCLLMVPVTSSLADTTWKVRKTYWTQGDERSFGEFVRGFGEHVEAKRCRIFADCMKGAWNPYRSSDAADVQLRSDCADLPYSLRMYFAWKNGLPFGYVNGVRSKTPSNDVRYSEGNIVVSRAAALTPRAGAFPDAIQLLNRVVDVVFTATFRLEPKPNPESTSLFDDFYSPTLDPVGIRPGTVIYDPNGHVAVVFRVSDDGRIHYVDAHPDQSVTKGEYSKKFIRSRPSVGAGFRAWRPIQLVGAQPDSAGNLIGGRIVGMTNRELADRGAFSTVQYFGNTQVDELNWSRGKFLWRGKLVDYYDYVRLVMAKGELKFHPLDELKNMMTGLCTDLQDRVASVQYAIIKGISKKTHPERLPTNIYGTSGEWEEYSTPSRDARLKTSFKEIRDRVEEFVVKHRQGDSSIEYNGSDLAADLLALYKQQSAACRIQYRKSDGKLQNLELDEVRARLFDLSFTPYNCAELRWGARGQELSACPDDATKRHWYDAQVYLRNQIDRRYDVRMDYTADELMRLPTDVGVREAPDVDVIDFLVRNRD